MSKNKININPKLQPNKVATTNDQGVPEDELKYYLSNWEYNDLLKALLDLITDYNERLEKGNFPGGGEGGGALPPFDFDYDVFTSKDTNIVIENDESMFTALRVIDELKRLKKELIGDENNPVGALDELFLSKKIHDIAEGIITFLQGVRFRPSDTDPLVLEDPGYQKTYSINQYGIGHLRGLRLDEWLEVPELIYNRVEVTVGDFWRAPGGGKIESVEETSRTTGIVSLKLDEGEMGSVAIGDICMGIFHFMGDGKPNNSADDFDDGKGNRKIKGFATCYFEITAVDSPLEGNTNSSFTYKLREKSTVYSNPIHPQPFMSFVGYGNRTNKNRQSSSFQTRTYERFLVGINDWEYGDKNIAAQFGNLNNISHIVGEHEGYSVYLNNVYISGNLEQIRQKVIQVELSNQNVGVVKGKDGAYILDNAWTDLHVLEGDDELKFEESEDAVLRNGSYRVKVEGKNITPGTISSKYIYPTTFFRISAPSGMLSTSSSIIYTVQIKSIQGKDYTRVIHQTIQETQGLPGIGVKSSKVTYQISDNGKTPPTSIWEDEIPDPVQGKYLWTRTRTTYTDSTFKTSYSVSYFAIDSVGEPSLSVNLTKYSHTYTFYSEKEKHPKGGAATWAEGKSVLTVSRGSKKLLYQSDGVPTYETFIVTVSPINNIILGTEGDFGYFVYPDSLPDSSLSVILSIKTLDSEGELIEDSKVITYNKLLDGVAGVGVPSVYRGEYNRAAKYYGNNRRIDIVKGTDKNYYRTVDFSGDNYDEFIQGEDPLVSGSIYWSKFGINFDSIATGLLMAEEGNIASFAFKDQTMYSQNGYIVDENGVHTEVIDGSGKINENRFKSNLYLNGKTGEFQARTGYIGGFTIHKDSLQSTHGTTPSIVLNGLDGSGHLANKNIMWNKYGEVTFGANVSLSWSSITGAPYIPDAVDDSYIKSVISDSYIKGTVDDSYIKGIINDDFIKATFEEAIETDFTTKITSNYITTQNINTLYLTSLGKVTAGSFSLGNGNFTVDDLGNLTAKNANIQGIIESNDSGSKIIINPQGRELVLQSEWGHLVGRFKFFDSGVPSAQLLLNQIDSSGTTLEYNIVSSSGIYARYNATNNVTAVLSSSGVLELSRINGPEFYVILGASTLNVKMKGLPTTAPTSSGAVWRDSANGNVLKIVP